MNAKESNTQNNQSIHKPQIKNQSSKVNITTQIKLKKPGKSARTINHNNKLTKQQTLKHQNKPR